MHDASSEMCPSSQPMRDAKSSEPVGGMRQVVAKGRPVRIHHPENDIIILYAQLTLLPVESDLRWRQTSIERAKDEAEGDQSR